jgi:hypothetical protein
MARQSRRKCFQSHQKRAERKENGRKMSVSAYYVIAENEAISYPTTTLPAEYLADNDKNKPADNDKSLI